MAPNIKDDDLVHDEIALRSQIQEKLSCLSPKHSSLDIVWRNVIAFFYLHIGTVFAIAMAINGGHWKAIIYGILLGYASTIAGITAGAHRLWAHKTYKGRLPMRVIAMLMNCVAMQNDIYEWARDHRAHHKFSETDADPHNAKRGFFFSHMGWLICKKHPDVTQLGGKVDMSDIANDPVVQFQRKYYVPLVAIMNFILSIIIPHYILKEPLMASFYICGLLRYCSTLHITWFVNSIAHIWGARPYDKGISPCEHTLVVVLANGEGWHNYHHAFPYDYKSNEFGFKLNVTTFWIDFCAFFGLAYDRRTVPIDMVKRKIVKCGDGSSYQFKEVNDF